MSASRFPSHAWARYHPDDTNNVPTYSIDPTGQFDQPPGSDQYNQQRLEEDYITHDQYDQHAVDQPPEQVNQYYGEGTYAISSTHDSSDHSVDMKVAFMYGSKEDPRLTITNVRISQEDSYMDLVRYILVDLLQSNTEQFHGYIMTDGGSIDITKYQRKIIHDFPYFPQNMITNKYHLLIMVANPRLVPTRINLTETAMYAMSIDQIVQQGGPFIGQEEKWIDITDMLTIKVAIAPCKRCSSGDTCFKGLTYSGYITVFEIKVTNSTKYSEVYQNLIASMNMLHRSTSFVNRVINSVPSAKDIKNSHLYLFDGTKYFNFARGDRLVFQDYHIWRNWADLSTNEDYGLYLHMCPANFEAEYMKYDSNIYSPTVWWGGKPNSIHMNSAIVPPLPLTVDYM